MQELTPDALVNGFIWYVAFLFSTTCHEAAHALVAKMGGDETASEGGQVSLNPFPHIRRELFGMVIVPLLSYVVNRSMIGWASAP
ncbi:MAG: site-2 protease family protein, partial [Candidatus Acidiferrum sp.]